MILLILFPVALISMAFKKRGQGTIGQRRYRQYYRKKKWTMDDYQKYWEERFIYIFEDDNDIEDSPSTSNKDSPSEHSNEACNTDDPPPKRKKRSQYEWRWTIAFIYEEILLSPPREEWYPPKGEKGGGTITEITKLLNMRRGQRKVVEKVLIECERAEKRGDAPNFDRKRRSVGPRPKKLEEGSIYEYLAVDYLERGCSPALTAYFVNIHLLDDNEGFAVSVY